MKKRKIFFAMALALIGLVFLFPLNRVQAGKKTAYLEPEAELEPGEEFVTEQECEFEPETEEGTVQETQEPETGTEGTLAAAETQDGTDDSRLDEKNGPKEEIEPSENEELLIDIEDNVQNGFDYQDGNYSKRATHTIQITRAEKILTELGRPNINPNIYETISYFIYEKTDTEEIILKEGSLEIPEKKEEASTNKIEMQYGHFGNYGIRIMGKRKNEGMVELFCHGFSIEKEKQEVMLKKEEVLICYGDTFNMEDYVGTVKEYEYRTEYEVWEESGEKNKILEMEKCDGRYHIKAVGINDIGMGTTVVTVRLKENPFMSASDAKTLTVKVNPMELDLKTETSVPAIYMYDTLAVKITIRKQGDDITQELLQTDRNLGICFRLVSEDADISYEINSKNLKSEKNNSYIFYIPVNRECFKKFSKGTQYDIAAELKYTDNKNAYFPYKVQESVKRIELLGRKAVLHLSAENNGIYEYRIKYKGRMPYLNIEIEDTTLSNEADSLESGNTALTVEAEDIVYQVSSGNEGVASVDDTQKYTAKDGKIPFCINGVGTTTLTVQSEGNGVYTVENQKIDITVENSPLYDEDFVIRIENSDQAEVHRFCGNERKSGFQEWQEYLAAHGGWIRGSAKIALSEKGLEYYDQIGMTVFDEANDGLDAEKSKQIMIDGDKKIMEYVFWAENNRTKADTRNAKDKENGTRSFKMGIDVTPPEIERLIPSADYYTETSTEEEQYYAERFVLTGSFQDTTSGVAVIEYTTDLCAKSGAKWDTLQKGNEAENSINFKLELKNGCYQAIAVRAIDAAGNISEPVCLKNKNGAFIKIIVDDTPPAVDASALSKGDDDVWSKYDAEDENWTNKELKFVVSEKAAGDYAGLYKVQYVYRSIASVLRGEAISDEAWQEIMINEDGTASFSVGENSKSPTNKNGYYYFRGVSRTGVISTENEAKRILLWQKMADKKPIIETGADLEKCYKEWYNKRSGTPVIDFAYPEYDTGVTSGEYAAPITIHYNLRVKDEKDNETILAKDKTAAIRAEISKVDEEFAGFLPVCDDLSKLQVNLNQDGIYTLKYWITDAAGNKSEEEIHTYKIDCQEPDSLKVVLNDEELVMRNDDALTYERFYQNSVSGEASAEYGISGMESIKLLKAKKIGEWNDITPAEDAEQFCIESGIRCLLYIRAIDGAGNMAEGWTNGIAVDNEAPKGDGTPRFIVDPKGANRHGFFNKDIKVKISIQDAPENGNCAGIRLVTSSVGTDGGDTVTDQELFSCMEERVSEKRMRETEHFSIIETIDAKANEGNHAYITVNATDRSGNRSTDTQELKIDVTKPEIEITFDNENAVNGRYYNTGRRAVINIKEINFDASKVNIMVTRNGKEFSSPISDWQSDKDNHYASVDFSEDGDYTLAVECTDLADNKADKASAEPFTIDMTMPRVQIAVENADMQIPYFNKAQTVIITVTEHNFNAEDFRINLQPSGKIGSWEHKNDTHVIKVNFLSEGEYAISCNYRDLAGNELPSEDRTDMPLEFVIDMTNPLIDIVGVENNSANAQTVIPNISVRDRNLNPETITIALTTGRGKMVDIGSDLTAALTEEGFSYTLNGLDGKPDDIYYLTVNAADKAGNTQGLTYRFSLNRQGSAYDLSSIKKLRENYYNRYTDLEDFKIVEMNVDKVEEFALYLSYNTDIVYGKNGSRPLPQNGNKPCGEVLYSVDVSGNEDTGYVYTYTVYRENFAREGIYQLGIYSRDKAGNEVNNLLKYNGEEIRFAVDNTVPRVVIDGVESNQIYDVEAQEVCAVVEDNFKLQKAQLMLVNKEGDVLESWNYFDLVEKEGDTAFITIGEHKEELSLIYSAIDAAGNEVKTLQGEKQAKADFLVTTDKLVQFVNKPAQTPMGRGIIAVSVLSALGIMLALVMLNRSFIKGTFLKKRK